MNTPNNPTQPASPNPNPFTRRGFLKSLAQTAAGTALAGCSLKKSPVSRPNIVIFLADDVGYADLGCYGGAEIQTPLFRHLYRQNGDFPAAGLREGKWVLAACLLTIPFQMDILLFSGGYRGYEMSEVSVRQS